MDRNQRVVVAGVGFSETDLASLCATFTIQFARFLSTERLSCPVVEQFSEVVHTFESFNGVVRVCSVLLFVHICFSSQKKENSTRLRHHTRC